MSCETWSLRVQITSTLFFLSRAASLRPAPPARAAAGGRAAAYLVLVVQTPFTRLAIIVASSSSFWQSKTLRAAQTRDHGLTTRTCVSSTSRKRGNQYALAHLLLHSSGYVHC